MNSSPPPITIIIIGPPGRSAESPNFRSISLILTCCLVFDTYSAEKSFFAYLSARGGTVLRKMYGRLIVSRGKAKNVFGTFSSSNGNCTPQGTPEIINMKRGLFSYVFYVFLLQYMRNESMRNKQKKEGEKIPTCQLKRQQHTRVERRGHDGLSRKEEEEGEIYEGKGGEERNIETDTYRYSPHKAKKVYGSNTFF